MSGSQCLGRVVQARGDLAHHFDANLWKLRDQVEEAILRHAQGLEIAMRDDRRGARHVAKDRDLADDVLAERLKLDRTLGLSTRMSALPSRMMYTASP